MPSQRRARTDDADSLPGERSLHVVLHDVAPPTLAACCRVLDALAPLGPFPVTLLAVPRYHGCARDIGFERWLVSRAEAGDEVALHGYTHARQRQQRTAGDWLPRRRPANDDGGFFDIDTDDARRRIDPGLGWLRDLGLAPSGFVAPAGVPGPGAWQVLANSGLSYNCTPGRIHLLGAGRSIASQAQVFSTAAAWRRGLATVQTAALARRQRAQTVVRLELHPCDADHAGVRRCWQRLLVDQARDRRASTLNALATRLAGGDDGWRGHAA